MIFLRYARRCLKILRIIKNTLFDYIYDAARFLKYSITINGPLNLEQYEAVILAHYHVIEKGLSLKDVRLGYGQNIISSLLSLLNRYKMIGYPEEKKVYKSAVSCLKSYIEFHERNNYPVDELKKKVELLSDLKECKLGGVESFRKEDLIKSAKGDFYSLAMNRHSIRDFSGIPVKIDTIIEAIKIAQKTPSVCNRQSSHVHIIADPKIKKQVLEMQNGSRGFGHLADKILVITSDLGAFDGIRERNQCFADAGMFAMSLLYSLSYMGLGACALNWCVDKDADKKFRKIVKIKESENIILFIVVGNLPDVVRVPLASRRDINDIIHIW